LRPATSKRSSLVITRRSALLGLLGVTATFAAPTNAFAGPGSRPARRRTLLPAVKGFPPAPPLRINVIHWGEWSASSRWSLYLRDPRWKDRWPYYTLVDPTDNSGIIAGDTQAVMDRNIQFWTTYGIDAVCFVYYQPFNDQLRWYNNALGRFLASNVPHGVSYSLILQGRYLVDEAGEPAFTEDILAHLRHPLYQRVAEDRPLLYLHDPLAFLQQCGSWDRAEALLETFRSTARQAGAGDVILTGLDPDEQTVALGFDACGAYSATGWGELREYPYAALREANRATWDRLGLIGREVILPLSVGWDPRPRFDDPDLGPTYRRQPWYAAPRPDELTQHILDAHAWADQHPDVSVLRTILVYAWNEYDEAFCLEPALLTGTASLYAVKRARDLVDESTATT
jgi:hypothetical protein